MAVFLLTYLGCVLTIISSWILPVLPFVFARADRRFVRGGLPMLVGMAATRSASLIAVFTHTPSLAAEIGVDR